jgi:predicted DNA-binding transcriptional regulator YafY
MNPFLCSAIRNRRVITFYYDGGRRIVEPYCHGASETGHDLLRGFQTAGYSRSGTPQGWKMFRLDELSGLAMTDEVFASNRPEYDPSREEKMAKIYCRIE